MAYIVGSLIGKTPFQKFRQKKHGKEQLVEYYLAVWYGRSYHVLCRFRFRSITIFIIILAAIASIAGTFGDLLESKLKRMAGVKDSGNIMPGHGGFLDRFDSLLLSNPCRLAICLFFDVNLLSPYSLLTIHHSSFSYICRMTIHKEGYSSIAWATILFGVINILSFYFISYWSPALSWIIFIGTLDLIDFSDFIFPHS